MKKFEIVKVGNAIWIGKKNDTSYDLHVLIKYGNDDFSLWNFVAVNNEMDTNKINHTSLETICNSSDLMYSVFETEGDSTRGDLQSQLDELLKVLQTENYEIDKESLIKMINTL